MNEATNPDMKFHNVRIAFSVAYWNGPLDGVCHTDDHFYWFSIHNDRYGGWIEGAQDLFWMPRIFLVYSMSFGEYQKEWQRHDEFEQAKRTKDTLSQWYNTSSEREKSPTYTDRLPAGWFSDEEIVSYADVMLSNEEIV